MAGISPEMAGAKYVYDVFHGRVKSTKAQEWIDQRKELKRILMDAFAKSIKLVYDEVSYGDIATISDVYVRFSVRLPSKQNIDYISCRTFLKNMTTSGTLVHRTKCGTPA
jgi:hypothetical protein